MTDRPTSSCEFPSGPGGDPPDPDTPGEGSGAAPGEGSGAAAPGDRSRADSSRILRFEGFRWAGVAPAAYRGSGVGWRGVARHALIGATGGGAPEATVPFHLRYFELEPGGHTTYERHEHHHVVVAIRGSGEVRLRDRWEPIGFGDVVYVAPLDPHQFRCVGDEPFGFLCVVSARRDPPEPLPAGPD